MSFFKKMTKEFDELKSTFGKGEQKKPEEHNTDPLHDTRGQQQFGQPSYAQGTPYGGAPPPGQNTEPQLQPGWIKQWDQNSQRWYFVEQASGRTQWEPPAWAPQGHGGQPTYPPQGGSFEQHKDDPHKEKGHGKMGAAAGGLAAGAVGGALLGHAVGDHSDSDSDRGGHGYGQGGSYGGGPGYGGQPAYGQQQGYTGDPSAPPLTGELPDETRDGDSVSGSDKEDVEEARENYQEELREGSGSDIEEAREEYEEEYEETYDD